MKSALPLLLFGAAFASAAETPERLAVLEFEQGQIGSSRWVSRRHCLPRHLLRSPTRPGTCGWSRSRRAAGKAAALGERGRGVRRGGARLHASAGGVAEFELPAAGAHAVCSAPGYADVSFDVNAPPGKVKKMNAAFRRVAASSPAAPSPAHGANLI